MSKSDSRRIDDSISTRGNRLSPGSSIRTYKQLWLLLLLRCSGKLQRQSCSPLRMKRLMTKLATDILCLCQCFGDTPWKICNTFRYIFSILATEPSFFHSSPPLLLATATRLDTRSSYIAERRIHFLNYLYTWRGIGRKNLQEQKNLHYTPKAWYLEWW